MSASEERGSNMEQRHSNPEQRGTDAEQRGADPEQRGATGAGGRVEKSDDDWRRELAPEQFRVLREHGTERAGTSPLNFEHRTGQFRCAGCGQALFESSTKFDSGTGWPSFFRPIEGAVKTSEDRSHSMRRTEVHCSRCGGHLGHVFPDGPEPTGLRYCTNGAALRFEPAER